VAYYLFYLGATFGNFRKKPDELTKVLRNSGAEVQVRVLGLRAVWPSAGAAKSCAGAD
jgi:hypothetical protein